MNQQQPQQIQEQQQEVVQREAQHGATAENDTLDKESIDNMLCCLSIDVLADVLADVLTKAFMVTSPVVWPPVTAENTDNGTSVPVWGWIVKYR
jgi:hypothetical protein